MSGIKEVRGIEVVSTELAPSPLSTPENPIKFNKVDLLTLSDGTITYGCRWGGCTFVADRAQSVQGHYRAHAPNVAKRWNELAEWSVAELMNSVLEFEEVVSKLADRKTSDAEKIRELRSDLWATSQKLIRRENKIQDLEKLIDELRQALREQMDSMVDSTKELEQFRAVFRQIGSLGNGS